MKYLSMGTLLMALFLMTQPVLSQQSDSDSAFISDFGDVPLMAGLVEIESERVVFDTEAGTIAETVLRGKVASGDIVKFYTQSLAQLGWQKLAAGSSASRMTFVRDKQILSLRVFESGGIISLLIHLEPGN